MKIRTRIFLVFLVIASAGVGALLYWVSTELRPRYLEAQEEPLVDIAYLLAELLRDDVRETAQRAELGEAFERLYARRFSAQIYNLTRDRSDLRVYVTDARGIVVFDSSGKAVGEDYSQWNDVLRALRGDYGARSTAENPNDPDATTAYVAAPILDGDRIVGAVSVGKPKLNLSYFVANAQQELLLAGGLVLGVMLVLGWGLYLWVSRPLQQLTRYARSVSSGERAVMPRFGQDEIGAMARAMEQMQTALDGKEYVERYVQTLTHELKSPISAIRAAAELLGEPLPAEERQRFLANIGNEAARLQQLVERLLRLAALEKQAHLASEETIDARALVAEVIESLRPLAAARAVTVTPDLPPDLRWRGERFLLRQAVENLLRNALEFSPTSATVDISVRREDRHTVLRVRDRGTGIPAYAMPRLYERFYSLPRPDGSKGTGLGLNFAREIAQLHGGTLEVRNAPDGGVEAKLALPAH